MRRDIYFEPLNVLLISLHYDERVHTVYTHHNMLPPYTTQCVTFALYGFFLDRATEDFFIALHQLSGHILGMRQSLGLQLFWTGKCLGGLLLVKYQSDGMWREALENAWAWRWVMIWGRAGPQEVDKLRQHC